MSEHRERGIIIDTVKECGTFFTVKGDHSASVIIVFDLDGEMKPRRPSKSYLKELIEESVREFEECRKFQEKALRHNEFLDNKMKWKRERWQR